jgi:hypothetical protein
MPCTRSRRDMRLVTFRGKTPTSCVFPVFGGEVREKCCDACGDEKYDFRSGFMALHGDGVLEVTTAINRNFCVFSKLPLLL